MKKRKIFEKGFTLVELLIVIALIAILSVAVLATINPIEQSNKARDAALQNDAAEVMNAYERYYANAQKYPWMSFSDSATVTVDSPVLYRSNQAGFGICYSPLATTASTATLNSCPTSGANLGLLIESDELKGAFAGKKEFQQVANAEPLLEESLMVYKDSGSGGSIYVCYIPKAKSNRQKTDLLYCLNGTGATSTRLKAGTSTCVALPVTNANWATGTLSATEGKWICVP